MSCSSRAIRSRSASVARRAAGPGGALGHHLQLRVPRRELAPDQQAEQGGPGGGEDRRDRHRADHAPAKSERLRDADQDHRGYRRGDQPDNQAAAAVDRRTVGRDEHGEERATQRGAQRDERDHSRGHRAEHRPRVPPPRVQDQAHGRQYGDGGHRHVLVLRPGAEPAGQPEHRDRDRDHRIGHARADKVPEPRPGALLRCGRQPHPQPHRCLMPRPGPRTGDAGGAKPRASPQALCRCAAGWMAHGACPGARREVHSLAAAAWPPAAAAWPPAAGCSSVAGSSVSEMELMHQRWLVGTG